MKAYPELVGALQEMLDRMDRSLREADYAGDPIIMYLAGGVAVNYWCGTRYTEDVDASFSRRVILPKDLTINYRRKDGAEAFIYFDHNYNTSFALRHDRFEEDSIEGEGVGNERRRIHLRVLSPVDLAVSKISRFSEQDQEDIVALGAGRTCDERFVFNFKIRGGDGRASSQAPRSALRAGKIRFLRPFSGVCRRTGGELA